MKTIHLILNAHLDPVWLWPWHAGLDEALATCRSACDRLDAHPDIVFTRGEAWVYRHIESVEPKLFARIRAHIEGGRWEIAGGWELQPDCNLPSFRGLQKQIELGRDYFKSRFGQFPAYAYNVDSFGHAASLPRLLRENGQRFYVMMRPQEHEMMVPSRVFRWRGEENGSEVVTFRIAGAYLTREITCEHIEASLSELPENINHTMCFVGVGDHGGGPTEKQIAWCRENQDSFEGARLEFSSPSRFFAAIEPQVENLPLVVGELQQHAIGCYSVMRSVKTATRRAENLLEQAEIALPANDWSAAWQKVCFAHFHDILGGTSIASAMPSVHDGLGFAASVADDHLQLEFRRRLNALPHNEMQRIVAWNCSECDFAGYLEQEPWLDWQEWGQNWRILDESGASVPFQRVHGEDMVFGSGHTPQKSGLPRLLFPAQIAAEAIQSWRIDRNGEAPKPLVPLAFSPDDWPAFSLQLIEDLSDTWSHGLSHFGGEGQTANWETARLVDEGPLMASLIQMGHVGASRLEAEWRRYLGADFIELRLRVHWLEKFKILKLVLPWDVPTRLDGIPGGDLKRENDGRELPLRDWTLGGDFGVVCPDVFALDADAARVRFTLLRSPFLAHHDPHPPTSPRARVSDQGTHEFRFRFFAANATPEKLESHAQMMQKPPFFADLTRGMRAQS